MRYLEWPVTRVVIGLTTLAGTWYVTAMLLPYMHIHNAYPMAAAIVLSVAIHELGHLIAFKRHGLSSMILFLVVLGGTMPLDAKKAEKLPDAAMAEVTLAGMFGNIAVMIFVVLGNVAGVISSDWVARVINLNAALILFNMIPLIQMDGSRFMMLLFHNVSPRFGHKLFDLTSMPVLIAMMGLLLIRGAIVPALPLILIGLRIRSHHTDNGGNATTPMTPTERIVWAFVYIGLVMIALAAFMLTPTWNHT